MLPGFSGDLVSEYFTEFLLPVSFAGELGEAGRETGRRALRAWWRTRGCQLGPASSIRRLFDAGAGPVVETLGYRFSGPRPGRTDATLAAELTAGASPLPLVVSSWGVPLDRAWPDVAREGLRMGAPWVLSFNGRELRVSDTCRLHARRHVSFDLETVVDCPPAFAALWALARSGALSSTERLRGAIEPPGGSLLDRIVAQSASHAVRVCSTLRVGVRESLACLLQGLMASARRGATLESARRRLNWTYDQALTLVYRVLFLLYAEARGLVPVWHPVYRDGYTVAALCDQAEQPGRAAGIWEGLQAVSRLAHAGCSADGLRVTPFNGRLFAPRRAPLAETRVLDDDLVRQAVLAVATQPGRSGRERVAFQDLGVEQLGSVYESVLEFEPVIEDLEKPPPADRRPRRPRWQVSLESRGDRRKASGTFYTPRAITEYLVRRTLDPLADGASPAAILALRVLDPAMGSGAFLVAACRFLAERYETALIREGACHASDITDADRAGFRRLVSQRCLYGVDLNPMAVQVARLSIWLTTLASDKPLTFLDHHLAMGDSLVGASLDDICRRPLARRGRAGPPGRLPLFDMPDAGPALQAVLPIRWRLADPDEDVAVVHEKERLMAGIDAAGSAIGGWKSAADLWCARWFWDSEDPPKPSPQEVGDIVSGLVGRPAGLGSQHREPRVEHARRLAERLRFFHWTLEFPEVFFDRIGSPRADAGFDAVVGNPPWDMIRGDAGDAASRDNSRVNARQLTSFVRESGAYTANGDGHGNRYQVFVERSLRLARQGGRIGLVLPWGLASDHGCEPLRRLLIERCRTDSLVSFDNADGIFPIHRGVRFLLLTASPGGSSTRISCMLGARDPAVLESIRDDCPGDVGSGFPLTLTADLLRRVSGPGLAIPHLRDRRDLEILEKLTALHPGLGDVQAGWGARFGRELNATDDKRSFRDRGDIPVVEGKHVEPFVVRTDRCARFIAGTSGIPSRRLQAAIRHARLGYRDVAASTNRLTLIAAIIPAGAITVHTVFCLRSRLDAPVQRYLCGILNSFVANFIVRLRVTTHVGVAGVERLPVPRVDRGPKDFGMMVSLVETLEQRAGAEKSAHARLQALAAQLYRLSPAEFEHVLASFPLVEPEFRGLCAREYSTLAGNG
jgi:hypothetical protein